jgi:hypothetical protein
LINRPNSLSNFRRIECYTSIYYCSFYFFTNLLNYLPLFREAVINLAFKISLTFFNSITIDAQPYQIFVNPSDAFDVTVVISITFIIASVMLAHASLVLKFYCNFVTAHVVG